MTKSNFLSTVSGVVDPSSSVEIIEGGVTSLGTTTADSSGNWTILADFTGITEGVVSIAAITTLVTSATLNGLFDKTPPAYPANLTVD